MKKPTNMRSRQDLYLSYRNDKDLIAFYQNTSRSIFIKAIKEALRLAIRPGYQTNLFKSIMPDPSWDITPIEGTGINFRFYIGEKDLDINELLLAAKNGRRSQVMKMALRFALGARYVVGNNLNGDKELNPLINKDNMFYIQKAPTTVVYKTRKIKETIKEVVAEPVIENNQASVIEKKPDNTPSFSLPDLKDIGTESTNTNDDFSDDDILSMLDSM